jgi:pimeloyl-ACP methyl ester carboxylesterase
VYRKSADGIPSAAFFEEAYVARFLFLHGSWHGAWCWHKIVPHIEAAGHEAVAVDLPGRGRSPATPAWVSMASAVRVVEAHLSPREKTTVVVHSRSGIVASMLAEHAPDRIARTIYLASFMLPSGKRALDYLPDKGSLLTRQIEVNRVGLWDWLKPEAYREALYADCSEDDVALCATLLTREPVRPALTRLSLTPERYGRVPRAYIRLTQDRAVSLALQDRLIAESPVERVASIDASHSAYFSKPAELASTVLKLAS